MIVSSSAQQSPVGIEMIAGVSAAEPKSLNSAKNAGKPFGAVFAGMVGKAAGQDEQGVAEKIGTEGKADIGKAGSKDEANAATGQKSAVSGLKDPEQGIMQELEEKPAALNPAMTGSGEVNAAASVSVPDLLNKLEALLKRLSPDTDPAADVLKSDSNSTRAMNTLQAVINDLKQAPVGQDALRNMKTEWLQNIKETLAKIAPGMEQGNGKKLVSMLNELKTLLKKGSVSTGVDASGTQQELPAAADSSVATAVPVQTGKLLADPQLKAAREEISDNSGVVASKSEIDPSSATWVEYVLQQQQAQGAKQTTVGDQKADSSTGPSGEPVTAAHTMSVSKGGQRVEELVSQKQPDASATAASAGSIPVADRQATDVRGANNNDLSLRTTNSHALQFAEHAANASKTDVTVKSMEVAESQSVGGEIREAISKEKFSFSDGSAQQNPGGQGGSTAATTAPAINVSGFEISVQNQGQNQVQIQPESSRIPVQEHIMNQVKEKLAQYEPASRAETITMKLNPGELGELKINMRMEDMRLKVDIVAQNQMVKDTIMQNVDSLRDMMSKQNITIDRFDVSTGGGQGSNQAFREGRNAAGSMPYIPYDVTPASGEEIAVQKAGYWDSSDNQLVNLRF